MELFYSWMKSTHKSFAISGPVAEVYSTVSVQYGLQYPFLMHAMLAMSALHLSIENPAKRAFYHTHAIQLQAKALADFNQIIHDLDSKSIVAAFILSSLTGTHVFCETFFYRGDDFNQVLDALTNCINILRGVRSVIGGWWDFLKTSELRPVLETAHIKHHMSDEYPTKIDSLHRLVENADIGASSTEAYKGAIGELERVYTIQLTFTEDTLKDSGNMTIAWLVTVPDEYTRLLAQRRPEALIILAYFAVLLHYRRSFWAMADSGQYLLTSISAYLGKHWENWLAWPLSRLENPSAIDPT